VNSVKATRSKSTSWTETLVLKKNSYSYFPLTTKSSRESRELLILSNIYLGIRLLNNQIIVEHARWRFLSLMSLLLVT